MKTQTKKKAKPAAKKKAAAKPKVVEEVSVPVKETSQDSRTRYIELLKEINRAFDFFNERFSNNELKRPVITISPAGGKRAYGWFGPRFWKEGEEESHEINLSAEHFKRKPEDVLETLLHEMAHLKNAQNKIEDTTATQYHNKHFKIAAESFGLKVDRMANRGFAKTELTDVSRQVIEDFKPKEELFNIYRRTFKRSYVKRYIPLLVRDTEEMRNILEELTRLAGNKVQAVEDALIGTARRLGIGEKVEIDED